jgi:hypothetical protein
MHAMGRDRPQQTTSNQFSTASVGDGAFALRQQGDGQGRGTVERK